MYILRTLGLLIFAVGCEPTTPLSSSAESAHAIRGESQGQDVTPTMQPRPGASTRPPEDILVLHMEKMAELAEQHQSNCVTMTEVLKAYQIEHSAELDRVGRLVEKKSKDEQDKAQARLTGRMEKAVTLILKHGLKCSVSGQTAPTDARAQ